MSHETRGHVGIAMLEPDHTENVGGVIRAAGCFDADYVATIGHEYGGGQPTAVGHDRHVPIWSFETAAQFLDAVPHNTEIIAVDYDAEATPLPAFEHPERAIYVLGQEGPGFSRHPHVLEAADSSVYIPADYCVNVAAAGNVVLADRYAYRNRGVPQ